MVRFEVCVYVELPADRPSEVDETPRLQGDSSGPVHTVLRVVVVGSWWIFVRLGVRLLLRPLLFLQLWTGSGGSPRAQEGVRERNDLWERGSCLDVIDGPPVRTTVFVSTGGEGGRRNGEVTDKRLTEKERRLASRGRLTINRNARVGHEPINDKQSGSRGRRLTTVVSADPR